MEVPFTWAPPEGAAPDFVRFRSPSLPHLLAHTDTGTVRFVLEEVFDNAA